MPKLFGQPKCERKECSSLFTDLVYFQAHQSIFAFEKNSSWNMRNGLLPKALSSHMLPLPVCVSLSFFIFSPSASQHVILITWEKAGCNLIGIRFPQAAEAMCCSIYCGAFLCKRCLFLGVPNARYRKLSHRSEDQHLQLVCLPAQRLLPASSMWQIWRIALVFLLTIAFWCLIAHLVQIEIQYLGEPNEP